MKIALMNLNGHAALLEFERGYAVGADLRRTSKRQKVDHLHFYWKQGYEAGRRDAIAAAAAYRKKLVESGEFAV